MALSSTLFCDRCGAANRAQAIFCSACGRSLHISANGTISNTLTGLLVQHPTNSPTIHNMPLIYEPSSHTTLLYLLMEYSQGETLEAYLDKMGGKLPVDKVLTIGIQLTPVLEYLHTHQPPIIFRDLKPAN